jgi:poly [ADP-ribose] polymerase 10/14/15
MKIVFPKSMMMMLLSSSLIGFFLSLQGIKAQPPLFQCGDGNYVWRPTTEDDAAGKSCPCSPQAFDDFVDLGCSLGNGFNNSQQPQPPETSDNSIYLAGIYDKDSFWWGEDIFEVTVKLYNEGFFDYEMNTGNQIMSRREYELYYQLADSNCDETQVIRAYWDLRTKNGGRPMDGVVGARCSGASLSLATVTDVENVPQVSPSSTSTKLSDDYKYRTFSRVVAPEDENGEAGAMVALLRAFGWDKVAILTTDRQFAKDWDTSLRRLFAGNQLDSSGTGQSSWFGEVTYSDSIRLNSSGFVDEDSIRQTLSNFPPNESRVIVLLTINDDAYPILKTAVEMNFQPDTIWVGPSSWVGRDAVGTDLSFLSNGALPRGYIGLTLPRNRNQYATSFEENLDAHLISKGKETWPELPLYAAEMVDSIVLLAKAIDYSRYTQGGSHPLDPTSIIRTIVHSRGVSGKVEFNEVGDRNNPNYSILNMGEKGEWKEIGVASTTVGSVEIQNRNICWATLGCNVQQTPSASYPKPKQKLPVWTIVVIVIVSFALLAVLIKYWRSRMSKRAIKNELEKLQNSVVGMRAATSTYVPRSVLENTQLKSVADSSSTGRVSLMLSSSTSIPNRSKVQWCWEETPGAPMKRHHPDEIMGDPKNCWIKYDDITNDIIEAAYQQQEGKGRVTIGEYEVDFGTALQCKISTGFQRMIVRSEISPNDYSISSCTDTDPISETSDLPPILSKEPHMILVEGDVVQISKTREQDNWAFGTKLYHADEVTVRELVAMTTACSNDIENVDEANICADTGWFPLDMTRVPTSQDLSGLQKNVGSDTSELEAPAHWDKIVDPLVAQRHKINPSDKEHQLVASAFLKTLYGKAEIIDIERIENLAMWQSYVVKRQTICFRETGQRGADSKLARQKAIDRFERSWLWHATNKEVVHKIIQQGFNRSFCGKNATVYGKGVYFARDAKYSSNALYSVPDKKGVQYMMACRVVVGEYCRGTRDAVIPDVRDAKTHTLYDSTVGLLDRDTMSNPSIYVTYHDAQAYPEYIIKFRST